MDKRIAALIIIFIVALLIGLAMNQPKPQCPEVCNDGNICTYDSCGPKTGYKCTNQMMLPCCGNGICEANEDCGLDCG